MTGKNVEKLEDRRFKAYSQEMHFAALQPAIRSCMQNIIQGLTRLHGVDIPLKNRKKRRQNRANQCVSSGIWEMVSALRSGDEKSAAR